MHVVAPFWNVALAKFGRFFPQYHNQCTVYIARTYPVISCICYYMYLFSRGTWSVACRANLHAFYCQKDYPIIMPVVFYLVILTNSAAKIDPPTLYIPGYTEGVYFPGQTQTMICIHWNLLLSAFCSVVYTHFYALWELYTCILVTMIFLWITGIQEFTAMSRWHQFQRFLIYHNCMFHILKFNSCKLSYPRQTLSRLLQTCCIWSWCFAQCATDVNLSSNYIDSPGGFRKDLGWTW